MTDLREFAAKGYIDRAPHYNSVFNTFEDPAVTNTLHAMIEESAKPLAAVETDSLLTPRVSAHRNIVRGTARSLAAKKRPPFS